MRWLALLVVALALVAAGCGGGDDESAASDETTIEETLTEETTSEETTAEDTTTDEDVDLSDVLADEDCQALVAAGAAFAQAFAGTSSSGDQLEAFEELADKVPDEIKADVQTLAEAYATYAQELEDIGIEAGATPTAEQLAQLQTAFASFDQEAVTAASERLSTWAEENCEAAGG